MPMQERSTTIRDAAIGGVITLIGSLALVLVTGAWAAKENAADHRNDMQSVRADVLRVLDLLCTDKPTARQCTAGGVAP